MSQNQLDRVHDAIEAGLVSLKLNLGRCVWHPAPRQPNIVGIATQNKKGCRIFYRILRAKVNLRDNNTRIESKWHEQLGTILSVNFWDNAWKIAC